MKKKVWIFSLILITGLTLAACRDVARTNIYDPDGENYIGITYKGEEWRPEDIYIKSMITIGNTLVLGVNKSGYGDTVLKGASGAATVDCDELRDIAADSLGNVFSVGVTLTAGNITKIDTFNLDTDYPLTVLYGLDKLSVEVFNDLIYVSSSADNTITRYSNSGVYETAITVTVDASGNTFTPGRIFRSSTHLFVVNESNKGQVMRVTSDLMTRDFFNFSSAIIDACMIEGNIELLFRQSVMEVDNDMNKIKQWGDFGEGPGRIFNGKLIAYSSSSKLLYILDGPTIKIFGE